MRTIALPIALFLGIVASGSVSTGQPRDLVFLGHRGFLRPCQENSVQSVKEALRLELDYIEFDVQLSKDGVLVINHDATVDRVFDGTGKVEALTLAELKRLRARTSGGQIATLKELLDLFFVENPDTKSRLLIELKGDGTAEPTVQELKKYRDFAQKVMISSSSLGRLKEVAPLLPGIPLCLNITNCKEFSVRDLMQVKTKEALPLPFAFISLNAKRVDRPFIDTCHRFGIKAQCFDFPGGEAQVPAEIQAFITLGIDAILFDSPVYVTGAREYLHSLEDH